METYEMKVTGAQLKALWEKTEWNDPYDGYSNNTDRIWEFLYLTERCPEVLKQAFPSVACDNEDANEIMNQMEKFWCRTLIEKYVSKHSEEVHEAFNLWWWSNHDVTEYTE